MSVIDQLSDSQRLCLRLVAQNKSSKEIAIEIGLSPQTIDQYLSRATSLLGASNRREAARFFEENEKKQFSKSELKSDELENPRIQAIIDTSPGGAQSKSVIGRLLSFLPPIGGRRHDLTPVQIGYAVLRISVVTTASVGSILATFFWLNRVLQ